MKSHTFLNDFIKECAQEKPTTDDAKFVGWEELIFTLVGFGLKIILPELKEWVKMGATLITMKRLEIKKKLIKYAMERELDFPAAEQAAEVIANKIDEENITKIIRALESS